MILRAIAGLALMLMLSACGGPDNVFAPDDQVLAARYVDPGPPSVTLFTVVTKSTGGGAHSALLINASERVIFDPAGTWHHPSLPERHDVHFGMTPKMVDFYIDYHARETFDVVEQTVVVSPGVAQLVYQRALANGAVGKALCANDISRILHGVPGFEGVPQTFGPKQIMKAFAKIPGVQQRTITDDDDNENHGVLILQQGDPRLN
jgi:hypothetical protein